MAPGGYLFMFPYQGGIVLFYWLLSVLFGSRNIIAYQFVNAFLIIMSLILLSKISGMIFENRIAKKGYVLIAEAFFMPYLFYVTFLYGNVVGFAFALLACYCILLFLRDFKWSMLLAGSICMALAVLLKSNYLIFLIAFIIYLVGVGCNYVVESKKRIKIYAMGVVMLVCCMAGQWGCSKYLTCLNGGRKLEGVPMVAYVAMGLQEGDRAPGWYNRYVKEVYMENLFNYEDTKKAARNEIIKSIEGFASNVNGAGAFFVRKISSQWNNPTFQSLDVIAGRDGKDGLRWLWDGKNARAIYISFMNIMQTWILAGCFLYAVFRMKKFIWWEILFPLIFIGGFCFHLFWEAKSIYAVPYFLLLIPICVCGYEEWFAFLSSSRGNSKRVLGILIAVELLCAISGTKVFKKLFARNDDEGIFNTYTQETVYIEMGENN